MQITAFIALLISLLLTTGCTLNADPQAKLSLKSVRYLNPNINGNPAPIVVSIFELKSADKFKGADYFKLSHHVSNLLGPDLIDKESLEIRPDSQQIITLKLSSDARYIGIMAAYRNIGTAKWRDIIKIPPENKKININVALESQGINVKLHKEHSYKIF